MPREDHQADDTLPATQVTDRAGDHVSLPPPMLRDDAGEPRYREERVLGEGGMGIVTLCRDARIGRSVALKVLRAQGADDGAQRRFLREAQLQGQLEHPAVLPVYDIAAREDGAIFFTMKRVRGVTLQEIIAGHAANDAALVAKYPRRRLLSAFAQVCLALEYAHSRGVVHRDLKPSNVMLGDFGEVYVLDWGIAKLEDGEPEERSSATELTALPIDATKTGALLGTPGYMAPEQVRGQPAGPSADIYALGAILFELLALEPLHPRGKVDAIFASTLGAVEPRPSVRAPHRDVLPELDEVCRRATVTDPAERYATVRELHDAIDRLLAGERDLELRRIKADEHARAALDDMRAALASGEDVIDARRSAMKQIAMALGLDPQNRDAIRAMVELLQTEPTTTPPEVALAIEMGERRRLRKIARLGAAVYLGVWLFLPLMLWIGVRDTTPLVILYSGVTVAGLVSLAMARSRAPDPRGALVAMLASNIGFTAVSGLLGPLVFVPTIAVVNTLAFTIHVAKRYRPLVVGAGLATFVVPYMLELAGVLPPSYRFGADGMTILPHALALAELPTQVVLGVAQVAAVLFGALSVGILRDNVDKSERRTYIYAWHLREFVPDEHKRETDPVERRGWFRSPRA